MQPNAAACTDEHLYKSSKYGRKTHIQVKRHAYIICTNIISTGMKKLCLAERIEVLFKLVTIYRRFYKKKRDYIEKFH